MPMRTLDHFCGVGEKPGGVQDSTNTVAGYMREQGIDTHVLVGSSEDVPGTHERFSSFEPDNVHILSNANRIKIINGSQNPLGTLVNPFRIKRELRAIDPDVFHINTPWMPQVGGLALRFAQYYDIPTVSTYHIVSDENATNVGLWLSGSFDRKPIQRLDAMIAVSEPARRHMEMTYRYKGDVHIIPNGVDIEKLEEAKPFEANEPFEGYDPNNPTLVFVGRPDPRKGLDELLYTFKYVHDDMPDAQLIICGGDKAQGEITEDETLTDYIAFAEYLGISSATHFMGRVSDEDKGRWFASADQAILPATGCESQGIVLLEAMAANAGVVIGGDNEGYASVFNPVDVRNSDLMLANPRHHAAFKEKIVTILNNDRLANELHAEQQRLVRAKYDIQLVGRQILDLYRSLR